MSVEGDSYRRPFRRNSRPFAVPYDSIARAAHLRSVFAISRLGAFALRSSPTGHPKSHSAKAAMSGAGSPDACLKFVVSPRKNRRDLDRHLFMNIRKRLISLGAIDDPTGERSFYVTPALRWPATWEHAKPGDPLVLQCVIDLDHSWHGHC